MRVRHIMPAIAALCVLLGAWWSGYSEWDASTFVPFNGHFQNYWSLLRMSEGETPFKDYPVYLGAGHLYAAWPLFKVLGGDFRAATAAHNALAGAMMVLSTLVTCRLLGWRWGTTLAYSLMAWLLFTNLQLGWSSVIGFRSFAPVVAALLVLWLLPRSADAWWRFLAFGVAAGAMIPWSNDYGFPAAIAMGGVLLLWVPSPSRLAVAAVGVVLGLVVTVSLASWGNPLEWLTVSVLRPSEMQGWYFNPVGEDKIYALVDLPWADASFLMASVSVLVLVVTHMWRRGGNPDRLLLGLSDRRTAAVMALVTCALGGFVLSCLGGTYEPRYSVPLWRYVMPVALTLTAGLLGLCVSARVRNYFPLVFATGWFPLGAALMLLAIIVPSRPVSMHPELDRAEAAGILVPSPSLGVRTWPEVAEADALGRIYRERGVNVLSNYQSVLSVASGSRQPGLPSYVIHPFGAQGPSAFHYALNAPSTRAWETLDHDRLAWGLWNVRMAWPLHRDLFRDWKPVARTPWTLVWERRKTPLVSREALCRVVNEENGGAVVEVSADSVASPGAWWADVSLGLTTDFRAGFLPVAGSRRLIGLIEGDDPLPGNLTVGEVNVGPAYRWNASLSRWTAPLRDDVLQVPVVVRDGAPTRLSLTAWPRNRAALRVLTCTARLVAPVEETMLRADIREPFAVTGSAVMPGRLVVNDASPANETREVFVFLNNPYEALRLRRGWRVILADGRGGTVTRRDYGDFTFLPDSPMEELPPGTVYRIEPIREADIPLAFRGRR